MHELGPVAWPPAPIRTERLVLREPEARDRAALIELFASPEVGTYIGGPRPRDELEGSVPEAPRRRPGLFVVDLDGAMIGMITLDRRDSEHPDHVDPEVSLGYMFLPDAWGFGYAAESCAAALDWFAGAPRRAGGALHPDRQRPLDAPRGKAGIHRGGAVREVRRRAVVRHMVLGHAVRLSSSSTAAGSPPCSSRSMGREVLAVGLAGCDRRGRSDCCERGVVPVGGCHGMDRLSHLRVAARCVGRGRRHRPDARPGQPSS